MTSTLGIKVEVPVMRVVNASVALIGNIYSVHILRFVPTETLRAAFSLEIVVVVCFFLHLRRAADGHPRKHTDSINMIGGK